MALALTLLIGAGLLLKSFGRLTHVDPGFNPERLLTFNLALPQAKYRTDTSYRAFYDEARARIAAVTGVQSVGFTSTPKMDVVRTARRSTVTGLGSPSARMRSETRSRA